MESEADRLRRLLETTRTKSSALSDTEHKEEVARYKLLLSKYRQARKTTEAAIVSEIIEAVESRSVSRTASSASVARTSPASKTTTASSSTSTFSSSASVARTSPASKTTTASSSTSTFSPESKARVMEEIERKRKLVAASSVTLSKLEREEEAELAEAAELKRKEEMADLRLQEEERKASASTRTLSELAERRELLEQDHAVASRMRAELSKKNEESRRLEAWKRGGIDLCFIMDCTSSMGPWINEAKKKIKEIAKRCSTSSSGSKTYVRYAMVAYRDFGDTEAMNCCKFTDEYSTIQEFIDPITASGGGDIPENIEGAFNEVLKLEWASETRLVIHITDAPCHGKKYHKYADDHVDKCRDPPELLLQRILAKKIDYYFGRITQGSVCYTDTMTDIFKSACPQITILDLGADVSKFLPAVMDSVELSLSKSSASRCSSTHNSDDRYFTTF